MTDRKALQLIRDEKPENAADFIAIGLRLEFLGHGVFREVYRILDTDLVVKFPLGEGDNDDPDYRAGKIHSTVEVRKIKALSAYPELKPHLPTIYYHSRKSGVLVMHWYPEYETRKIDGVDFVEGAMVDDLGVVLRKLIWRLAKVNCSDIHWGNVHQKLKPKNQEGKTSVLIDLGY